MDLFADNGENSHSDGVKLFGVTLRKSASAGELCQNALPDQPQQFEGYATDGFGHNFSRSVPRKRGVPWTEEEHRLFLKGLEKLGKGDWRGISRLFVKSRTPTQVASHAQKFYLRQKHVSRKKRRSSLFDICHDHHKIQMEGSVHSMATPPVSWWCASPGMSWESISTSMANQTVQTIDENGCGLNLSIAPPSMEAFKGNVSFNRNSAIRVL